MKKKQLVIALAIIGVLCAAFLGSGDYAVKTNMSEPSNSLSTVNENGLKPAEIAPGASESEKAVKKTADNSADKTVEKTDQPPVSAAPSPASRDRYLTDPVPAGKPQPVEWRDAAVNNDKKLTCTLTVSCATILDNMQHFNKDKLEVLPEDGIIYPRQTVIFYEGESVFNILQREMKKKKIHLEFEATPVYNSNYIEGINNLYEFDCGELSGWIYKVNGWLPNYGCSRYMLQDGDIIEWLYTCDLGRDVGEERLAGFQGRGK